MDAKELTQKYYALTNEFVEVKKQVEFLTQEFEKQRLIIEDMKIDVQMLSRQKR